MSGQVSVRVRLLLNNQGSPVICESKQNIFKCLVVQCKIIFQGELFDYVMHKFVVYLHGEISHFGAVK